MELVGRTHGQQRHVSASRHDAAHRGPSGLAAQASRTAGKAGCLALAELAQADLDLTVHDGRELVVAGGPPFRGPFGADGLDDVLAVLAHDDLLPGPCVRRDLEDVGEGIASWIVVDDLHATFLVIRERPEPGRVLAAHGPVVSLLHRRLRWGPRGWTADADTS